MLPTTVITTFSPSGYLAYAYRFVATAVRWPKRVKFVLYVDEPVNAPRAEIRKTADIHALTAFKTIYGGDARCNGREIMPCWKAAERAAGYSFRTDAAKFCHKVFAIEDAARRFDDTRHPDLADADVVTTGEIPDTFAEELLGQDDVIYLGRDRASSECGFLIFRLPEAMPLILLWANAYRTGHFLTLPESHDSFVFDWARTHLPYIACRSLTKGTGHVWCDSPLSPYLDHCKGARKTMGYSPEMLRVRS